MLKDAKPAASDCDGHRTIQIGDFKPFSKNTLKGVFTVTLPSGMVIHGCMLHESNGSRWVGLPGKPYTNAAGKQTYQRIIDFVSRPTTERFRDAVLDALDTHLAQTEP